VIEVVADMPNFIDIRNGKWWVENPAHKAENFADKWNSDPMRKRRFDEWMRTLVEDLGLAADTDKGLDVLGRTLGKAFGDRVSERAITNYAKRVAKVASAEQLGTAPDGRLTSAMKNKPAPRNTFHGPTQTDH
jgi:hypothetical protein